MQLIDNIPVWGSPVDEGALRQILAKQLQVVFEKPLELIFYRAATPIIRYLFLKRCFEAELAKQEVSAAEITDSWLKATLEHLGLHSNFDARRLLMDSSEMLGLTAPVGGNHARQQILSTVIWQVIKDSEQDDVSRLIETFAAEISQADVTMRFGASAVDVSLSLRLTFTRMADSTSMRSSCSDGSTIVRTPCRSPSISSSTCGSNASVSSFQ